MKQLNIELVEVSTSMQEICEELDCAVRSDAKVLITGEDSFRREAIARLIHQRGRRATGPFVAFNCSATQLPVPHELLGDRGLLQQAVTGTAFIDEIGEMDPRVQAELLRFLDGDADVCIIAATNRNLYEDMIAGRFREDLYYRLNIIHIVLAPQSATAQSMSLPVEIPQSLIAAERRSREKAV